MPYTNLGNFNWLAVAVAALAAFVIGAIWYTALCAKVWVKAHGFTEQQVKDMQASMKPPVFFGGMLVSYFVLAVAMELIIWRMNLHGLHGGLKLGAVFWLVVASINMTHHLASGKVIAAYLIDAGCELVYLLAMGAILVSWR